MGTVLLAFGFFNLGGQLRDAEIQDLGLPALRDEDVRRLDVAMHDAFGVRGFESIGDLNGEVEDKIQRKRLTSNALFQGRALKQLHHEKMMAVDLSDLMDGADMGMVQRRGCSGFTLKSLQGFLTRFGRKELEGHMSAKGEVFGFIDRPHAAASQLLQDAVVRDRPADHRWTAGIQKLRLMLGRGLGDKSNARTETGVLVSLNVDARLSGAGATRAPGWLSPRPPPATTQKC
jgi:hypothetical protein